MSEIKSKTITLDGSEVSVSYKGFGIAVRNDSADTVYASGTPGIVRGSDGVVSIPAGSSVTISSGNGTLYLVGTGSVFIMETSSPANPFKTSAQSGGSGADTVARAAITEHSGNSDIHVTVEEKTKWNAKAELSDIPSKLPADGGNSDTVGGISPVDFLRASATRKLSTSLNGSGLFGTYYCESRFTPDYPKDSSDAVYGQYGLLDVRIYGSIFYQTMMFENGIVIHRAKIAGATEWSSWQKLNEGGNAVTLGSHPASDFVLKTEYNALVSRVEALEAK